MMINGMRRSLAQTSYGRCTVFFQVYDRLSRDCKKAEAGSAITDHPNSLHLANARESALSFTT